MDGDENIRFHCIYVEKEKYEYS